MTSFAAIADGVYLWRCPTLDVNSVLVVGRERALLVDTLSTAGQAEALATGVASLTSKPVTVVNTHDHFDHVFGNATIAARLPVTEIWGQRATGELLADADTCRAEAAAVCRRLAPEITEEVTAVEVLPPDRLVETTATIALGGRTVRLWHPGRAHSGGDLVIYDEAVCCAGDLVEESGPPFIGPDSDVSGWRAVLRRLRHDVTVPIIPGHGAVVDATFLDRQLSRL